MKNGLTNNNHLNIFIILALIGLGSIMMLKHDEDNKYTVIKPIIMMGNGHAGEEITNESDIIMIGQAERVSKEFAKDYLTEENYKNILTHNTFFKDNLPPEHRLKLQDIITIDK